MSSPKDTEIRSGPGSSRRPRHALECELHRRLPDADTRAALAEFYKTNIGYANQQAEHEPAYFTRLLSVVDAVVPEGRLRVLEVGSGSGGALRGFLASRPGTTAIALEVSAISLQRATAAGSSMHAVAGNALDIPLRSRSVHAVLAFEVIEHLPDVTAALDEMLRVVQRPGHIIIGLPNHASLWTPLEDRLRRRDRRAFGVERGRGAWRWWKRNAALAWRKRRSNTEEFLYREPILHAAAGGDADAVYYAAPIDLMRFFRGRGATLATSSARRRLGWIGRLVPVELQGSTVMAWRVTDET